MYTRYRTRTDRSIDLDDAAGRLHDIETDRARREQQVARDRRALKRDPVAQAFTEAVEAAGLDGLSTREAAAQVGVEHVDASALLWRLSESGRVVRIDGQSRCWVAPEWSGSVLVFDPWWSRLWWAMARRVSRH